MYIPHYVSLHTISSLRDILFVLQKRYKSIGNRIYILVQILKVFSSDTLALILSKLFSFCRW